MAYREADGRAAQEVMTAPDHNVNKKPGVHREVIPQVCTGPYHMQGSKSCLLPDRQNFREVYQSSVPCMAS